MTEQVLIEKSKPKCFGSYDDGEPKCEHCPYEKACFETGTI